MATVALKNGTALLADGSLEVTDILIEDGIIKTIGTIDAADTVLDIAGLTAIPGLIDVHTHGIRRTSIFDDEPDLYEYARLMSEKGTTAFFPTFFSPPKTLPGKLRYSVESTNSLEDIPQIPGIRMESPYLAKTGAGTADDLVDISDELTDSLIDAADGTIMIWDISPELPGAIETIARLADMGITTSMAHTSCTMDEAKAAVDAGLRLITHMFDTFDMPEMTDPGVYPAGITDYLLTEDAVWCEIIADGTHVHPLLVEVAFRCKTPDRLVFVTDSNYGAGFPPGEYDLPTNWGRVRIDDANNGVRLIERNMTLAGSALTPINNFRNAVNLFGKDISTASQVCSKTPAKLLGLNKGEIAEGRDGDIVVLDESLEVIYTISMGEIVFNSKKHQA
jgi:N-acetylglucosamine-6-phosphate deacetylase